MNSLSLEFKEFQQVIKQTLNIFTYMYLWINFNVPNYILQSAYTL